ncbi:hypothetical protein R1sor_016453 [Riccia sorocarpa]|uniref:Uncharacterized protein n=1 Tax=Riccia sorocarpa TaxID=122646 RepID=A0ABD3HJ23_9MARC
MGDWLKKARSGGDPEQSGTFSGPGAWRDRGSPSTTTDHLSNGTNARRVIYLTNGQGERFSPGPSSPSNAGTRDCRGHPSSPQGHTEERSLERHTISPNNQGWTSPQQRNREPQDLQTNPPFQPLETTARSRKSASPVGSPSKAQSWADKAEEDEVNAGESEEDFNMSDINSEQRADQDFMAQRNWVKEARREVTAAFSRIQEFTGTPEGEEVAVEHHFNTEEQMQIHAQKRRLEDCGVVFVPWIYPRHMMPSRSGSIRRSKTNLPFRYHTLRSWHLDTT